MQWLMLLVSLEAGIVSGKVGITDSSIYMYAFYEEPPVSTYVDMGLEVRMWDVVFIGGGVETHQVPVSIVSWNPHKAIYDIYGGVRLGGFEVGITHSCTHPVLGTPAMRSYLMGAETKIYGKWTGKIGGTNE